MMHKVMIIDDDVPVLKVLEQMINWEELNLQLIGTSYSSTKAMHLFQEMSPDIIITDIGLPKKNGIELAEMFIKQKPGVRIIFLTCHEDFHYAQQAVKLDADDYLIKDQLTEEQLKESLLKSIRFLAPKDQTGLEKMSNYNNDLYKQGLFQRIIDGVRTEEILVHAKQLGIKWEYPDFMIAEANMVYATFDEFYEKKDILSILYAVYNIAVELSDSYEGITVFLEQENKNIIIIYNFRPNLAHNTEQHLQHFMKNLYDRCVQFLKIRLRILIFTDRTDLQTLRAIYLQTDKELNLFYEPEDVIVTSRKQFSRIVFSSRTEQFLDNYKAQIERTLVKSDKEGIASVLQEILSTAKDRIEPHAFISSAAFLLRELEMAFAGRSDEDCYYYMGIAKNADDVLDLMQRRLNELLLNRGERTASVIQEPKLQVIQNYIDEHLSENITSIDMAYYLYLNPSYFSRYFKRLTGINFTDYVHQYKMEIASKILKTSNQTLESVSMMLGYSDRPYFSKVFKKYVGMTPSDYKLKHGLGNSGSKK
ncbi:response regulator [Paenibacillus sp. IITD108]|uniref:response regulator n=1 Tax=Paenibacillus sp. IITD108 TaxID=3116649 RepID=UPI002F3F2441